MSRLIILFILVCGILTGERVVAQNNIGIKFFGLSIHPGGERENAFLMPNRLDRDAYLVMNLGAKFSYENFLYDDIISVKIVQAIYADCAARLGGFSHIGIRAKIFKIGKHSLHGGIGPTIIYRRNWQELDGYVNLHRFKGAVNDRWQYLFLWYGGEFEYKYAINDLLDLSASFVPGYPDLMSFSLGVNLNFNN